MSAARRFQAVQSALHDPQQDVVIVSACRTPICRAGRGGLKDTDPTDLLAVALKAVTERVSFPREKVDDVVVGNVLLPGAGAVQARMAMFLAGYPETTSIHTLNRQCSSGLQAIASVAASLTAGHIDVGVAAGLECMSFAKMGNSGPISEAIKTNDKALQCTIPMGITSENVAARYGIGREEQDRFAFASFQKALAAQKAGKFDAEIVPVATAVKDQSGAKTPVTVAQDDGPRSTPYESLAKLKPAFKPQGCSTAGNSSQVSDGAAAVLLMRRATAQALGLPVLAAVRSFAVAGCRPDEMGIGPVFAIPKALAQAGVTVADIDVFEINEAFASQCLYCVKKLNIPVEKVNPLGGAIALGHPLGSTGCRQTVTLIHELKRRGGGKGVVSMCIGTGMGAAAVFEVE
uniref:acetyl-CoA C-acyltransferase n=1 Tax=Euglena gracilis TaxID=3039 RepID=A0A0F7R2C4_EUGGR|nr:putative 3-ketoacyl-CoA thiolase [Euglena gracilis]